MKFHISIMYYFLFVQASWLLETPCESRDFESSKASFNNGFKLSVCSLARYKIACELIKFSTGNLPSLLSLLYLRKSSLFPGDAYKKSSELFLQGVLSIKVKWSMLPFLSIALCFALW